MITANFIHRTFRIAYLDSVGTAFAIDVDGRQYLVTAKHVVESFRGRGTIDFFGNDRWTPTNVMLVGHAVGDIDISVFAATEPMCPAELAVTPSSVGLAYGQDIYFLGFPYGVLNRVSFAGDGFPLPLVKRGLMSGFDGAAYLLDGHNNPGFSGGPVIFSPNGGASPSHIAGVISFNHSVVAPVTVKDKDNKDRDTKLKYETNSGIIYCYKIEEALALIQSNPIGVPVC